jgi:RimJ/RimL family protein N-acetyltransferase
MQKVGMKYDGTLRERRIDPDGTRSDIISYSITKNEL